ncbi:MAG: hypothetical protein A3H97_17905 [Acidobacteria bacterium RIFCSPLOWO2_02_FULL_65_29]|nr:MAG: hypothetical protein A3H97_17905 [Acidobacteria bacterium RIFCSPLOWO2_02_FULL_65_29]
MRYVPYEELQAEPSIIVDGAAASGTLLTLSHWPKSGTPEALGADTSAAIVFNYLDAPAFHVDADAVSNNHFDEDGLVGIFSMVDAETALANRRRLIDVATAGDFGVYATREAARMAFTLAAHADEETSPLEKGTFALPYGAQAAVLYRSLLNVLPRVLANVDDYRRFWEAEDARLTATERLIDTRVITIEERAGLDLAIVRIPTREDMAHPYALHTRTPCSRLLVVHGRRVEVRYRYEGWVQFRSRPVAPRVDLCPLAQELNTEERTTGRWVFDGVDAITPSLHFDGVDATSLSADAIASRVEHHLRTGPPAWNPYLEVRSQKSELRSEK